MIGISHTDVDGGYTLSFIHTDHWAYEGFDIIMTYCRSCVEMSWNT